MVLNHIDTTNNDKNSYNINTKTKEKVESLKGSVNKFVFLK